MFNGSETHRIKVLENANGKYEWLLYVSNGQKLPSARSPRHYDEAYKAREEAVTFAQKMSRLLKCRYRVIDTINGLPVERFDEGVNVNVENCIKDKRKAVAIGRSEAGKLTELDAMAIKKLIYEGTAIKDIAKLFNVTEAVVKNIKNGVTWKHLQ